MHALNRAPLLGLALCAACPTPPSEPAAADAAGPAPAAAEAAPAPAHAPASPQTWPSRTWTFDESGPMPAGFTAAETAGAGTPATWAIVAAADAPSPPSVFGITKTENPKTTFNLALLQEVSVTDVDLTVMVKAGTGALDRGGGPVWRVRDVDNYYVARWNPLENNVRFYVVVGGVRSALGKADLELPQDVWHSLRVVAQGDAMELFVDDEPVLRVQDATHAGPGAIGLWTKADAATLFDDLSIAPP